MPPTERKNTALQTFVPISTEVENQNKTKGSWTGWWFTAVHATLANQQPQYLREVHESAAKRLSKV